jgi:DamX protein
MLDSLKNGGHKPIHPGERAAAAARAMGGALRGFNVRKYTAVLAAAAFVLVAVAIGVVLASRHTENTKPGTVEISLPTPSTETPPAVAADETLPASAPVAAETAAPVTALEPAPQAPAAATIPTPLAAAETTAASVAPAPHEVAPSPVVAETVAAPAAPEPSVAAPAVEPVVVIKPKPQPKLSAKSASPARTKTIAAKSAVEAPSAAQRSAKSNASATNADDSQSFYSSAWVKRQKPQSLVLQLFGSRDRAATTRFIRDHGIGEKAAAVEVKLKGAPWYVVVTGLYTSRSAANAAIHAMPAPLAKQKPWPRAVSTLK